MKKSKATENLHKAFKLFEAYPDELDCVGKIPKDLVESAEKALELKFPATYKIFIEKYGYCGFFGEEFYGIGWKSLSSGGGFGLSSAPDGIGNTLSDRKKYQLPHKYIIVGAPGYGPYDAIDTSKLDANGECPVVMIEINDEDPVTKEKEWHEMEQLAPDFGTYLYNQSKEALDNHLEGD